MTSGLPPSWTRTTLGELVAYGSAPKVVPTEIAPDAWVLELEDVERDTSRVLQRRTFAERQSKSTKTRFKAGDVLYGKLRPYLNKIVLADGNGYCTTEIVPITAPPGLDARYLFYAMRRPEFLDYVASVSHGLNMPRLGTKAANEAPIPLAPTNEQKRIADKLDQLLEDVDACKARLDRVRVILKRFRQSVLAAAADGSLLEVAMAGERTPLGELGDVIAGQSPAAAEVNIEGRGEMYITGPEQWDGKSLIANKWTEHPRRIAPDSSIFITVKGAGVGKTFPGAHAAIGRDVYAFVPRQEHNYKFVLFGIQAVVQDIVWKAKGLIPGLTKRDIIEHEVFLPARPDQDLIVERVEALLAAADALEAKLTAAQARVDKLTQSLLAKAFRGELVPQDPSDEHAEALLERIRAERAAEPAGRTRRRSRSTVTT